MCCIKRETIVVGLVILFLGAFHAVTLNAQALFVDEVDELGFATGPFWDAVWMPDSMPPFFQIVYRGWLWLAGASNLRWFGAIVGLVSSVAVFHFSLRMWNLKAAVVTTLLFALNPLQLYYAQLARGYIWFILVCLLAIGNWLLFVQTGKRKYWYLYIACCMWGAYVHYYFALVPFTLAVTWCVKRYLNEDSPIDLKLFITSHVILLLVAVPVVVFLRIDFQYQHDLREPRPLNLPALGYTYLSLFSGYALGPGQRMIATGSLAEVIRSAAPWMVTILGCCALILPHSIRVLQRSKLLVTYVLLITLPLACLWLAGLLSGITYNVRHVCWLVVPLTYFLGAAFAERRGRWAEIAKHMGWAGVLCLFCWANYQRLYDERYVFEDLRSTWSYLVHTAPEQPVFVVSDYEIRPLQYYNQGGELKLFELPVAGTRSRVIVTPEQKRELQAVAGPNVDVRHDTVAEAVAGMRHAANGQEFYWFVYARPYHGDPAGLMFDYLNERGLKRMQEFAGVEIYQGRFQELTKPE